MRATILLGVSSALMLAAPIATRADEDVSKKLAGTYTFVSGNDGTLVIPEDRLKGSVKIDAEKMVIFDAKDKEVYVIRYELKGDKAPYKLAMRTVDSSNPDAEGSKAVGILKLDGDTLTLMYDYSADGVYPEAFTPQTDKQHLFVMKRKDAK